MNAVLEQVDQGDDLGQTVAEPEAKVEAPEPEPAKPTEVQESPKKQDTVPHAALHEAREQNKALRAQIAALEAQPKLTSEDAELLKELRANRAAAQTKEPDFLEDPKGYVDTKFQAALKKLEATEQTTTQTREQLAQQHQLQQLVTTVQSHEAAFVKTTPDYQDALNHVRTIRMDQLKLFFPQATDAQIGQQLMQEEIQAAAQALQAGVNPAETVYRYAKTLGYQPKAVKGQVQPDRSAAMTLGSGGGAGSDVSETEDTIPELTMALKERFGVRRR